MTKNSDEPFEMTTPCGSLESGQLASSAGWPSCDDEVEDDCDKLLASMGRTEEQDRRIAVHELSHFFFNRLLGTSSIREVTINPISFSVLRTPSVGLACRTRDCSTVDTDYFANAQNDVGRRVRRSDRKRAGASSCGA